MSPPLSVRFALGFGALLLAGTALADDVRVDVVIDFNREGYKVVRPSADKPAYYYPIPVGYTEVGDPVPFQKPPPPPAEIEHYLAEALFAQGYRLTTRQSPPSLLFIIRWGYMAPRLNQDSEELAPIRQNAADAGDFEPGRMGGSPGVVVASIDRSILSLPQYTQGETLQMLSLVYGDTLKDRKLNPRDNQDVRMEPFLAMARQPRYFLMLEAYDYKDWMQHYADWRAHHEPTGKGRRPMLLWEAHISTELAGHSLEEVLPALITTAAPLFGHETKYPQFIEAPAIPLGHVEVGVPVLKLN